MARERQGDPADPRVELCVKGRSIRTLDRKAMDARWHMQSDDVPGIGHVPGIDVPRIGLHGIRLP